MALKGPAQEPPGLVERLRYARVLEAGMRTGLATLAAGFVAYLIGWLPARVALDELPLLWTLPASEFLRATGTAGGWGWIASLSQGEALPLLGIAVLAAVPLGCFLALIPYYAARRDWVYFSIVALQIGILVFAASGVLAAW